MLSYAVVEVKYEISDQSDNSDTNVILFKDSNYFIENFKVKKKGKRGIFICGFFIYFFKG